MGESSQWRVFPRCEQRLGFRFALQFSKPYDWTNRLLGEDGLPLISNTASEEQASSQEQEEPTWISNLGTPVVINLLDDGPDVSLGSCGVQQPLDVDMTDDWTVPQPGATMPLESQPQPSEVAPQPKAGRLIAQHFPETTGVSPRDSRHVDTQAVPKAPRPVHEEAKHAKLHVEHAALVKRSERGIKIPRNVIDPTLPPRVKAVNPDVLERVTRETEQAREQAAVAGLSDQRQALFGDDGSA